MGWKAADPSMEREAKRRQRELDQQRKQAAKMEPLERAKLEVAIYDNYIDLITSVHQDCGPTWDWNAINSGPTPKRPVRVFFHANEDEAQAAMDSYKPGRIDSLMGRAKSRQQELEKAVNAAKQQDEDEYEQELADYAEELVITEISGAVLEGDGTIYNEVIRDAEPFSEISYLGSTILTKPLDSSIMEATLITNNDEVIPKEVRTLLESGKVSVKKMSKTRYYGLYQAYVCGCVLRIARELHALLPINAAVVTAKGNLLNSATGHLEEQPILSAEIPRATLETLNFDTLDPSDSMQKFVHNMNFLETKGFRAVEKLVTSQII